MMMKCGCAATGKLIRVQGVELPEPKEGCLVHECYEPAGPIIDLSGRKAVCSYAHRKPRYTPVTEPVPSDPDKLAFFQFRGEGSREATEICKCGYHRTAHKDDRCPIALLGRHGKPSPSRKFEPKGPQEFDHYYCGCMGWD